MQFLRKHYTVPLLAGLTALFFLPVLVGVRTFPAGDFSNLYLSNSIFFRRELAALHLPRWNPYVYSGHPFLADPQAAVFYPLNLLFLLLSLPWAGIAGQLYWLQLEAVFHLFLAGWFTYLLVWDLTHRRMAALMAATTFMFSGYLTGYPPQQLTILRTAVWLPLLLWLLHRALVAAGGKMRWWLLWTLAYATAFLAGHPQTFIYLSYVMVAWALFLLLRLPRAAPEPKQMLRSLLLRGGVAALIFLGLIAVQLLPGLEFARLSVRAHVDYDFLSGGATSQDFWQFVLPSVWSALSPLYVGVVATGLAGIAVLGAAGARVRPARARESVQNLSAISLFFAGVALIALLVSMGRNGPLYPLFYHLAPGWKLFRNQERAAYVVSFSLSVLAGLGMVWLDQLSPRWRSRFSLTMAGILLAGVAAFFIVWRISLAAAWADAWFSTTILITLAGILGLVYAGGRRRGGGAILLGLGLLALFYANWDTLQAPIPLAKAAEPASAIIALQEASADCTIQTASCARQWQGLPGRIHNDTHLDSGFGPVVALDEVWGTSPLRLQRYQFLFDDFPMEQMWKLTGVEHVLTWRTELFEPAVLLQSIDAGDESMYLYRLAQPHPRAWFVDEVLEMPDIEARQAMAEHQIDLNRQALVSPNSMPQLPLHPDLQQNSQIHIQRLAADHLQIQIGPDAQGFLVLSENWMPGWTATRHREGIDEKLTLVRADVTLQGIVIPAGGGTIDVRYRPASIRVGLGISLGTIAILFLFLILQHFSPSFIHHDSTHLPLSRNP